MALCPGSMLFRHRRTWRKSPPVMEGQRGSTLPHCSIGVAGQSSAAPSITESPAIMMKLHWY